MISNNIFDNCEWIWHSSFDKPNSYVRFIGTFTTDRTNDVNIYLSVDSNYALYINGNFAETGQYADYADTKICDLINLDKYIKDGENSIIIDCYHQGDDSSTLRCETAGLIFSVTENDKFIYGSNSDIKCSPITMYNMGNTVEKVTGQLGYTFHYDNRIDIKNYENALYVDKIKPFDLRPINKLETIPDVKTNLTVHGIFTDTQKYSSYPPAFRMQYSSLAFREPNIIRQLPSENGIELTGEVDSDGVFAVIDLGEENTGLLSFDIEVPSETLILIGWGEHLCDMRVRTMVGGRCFAASYFASGGRNKFVNYFRRLGLRYLQIHIYSKYAKIYYAGIHSTLYKPSEKVSFVCADNLHNKIYDVSIRTLIMCMHEHYEDCPWREQALYTMDSRNQMLCGYYTFKEYKFARASLKLMAQSIRDDNLLELCSPARVPITIPSFSAIFPTQVYEYVLHSNDIEFAIEMLPYMNRIINMFISKMDEKNGLIPCFTEKEYWNFYEWQEGLSGTIFGTVSDENITYDAPLCAFVSMGIKSYAAILNMLGYNAEYSYYNVINNLFIKNIDKFFWSETENAYASFLNKKGELNHFCELTNSLMVYSEIAQDNKIDKVLDKLANNKLLYVTISHSIFKYEALLMQPQKYARYVFSDIADKWGYMLYNNATTFWETIKGDVDFGNAGSLCHGWSAIPAYFYLKYALKSDPKITGIYECQSFTNQ